MPVSSQTLAVPVDESRHEQITGMRRGVFAALGALLLVSGSDPAHAERAVESGCKILRTAEAAFLQQCDRQLRSFALSMPGAERTAVREHTNKFQIYLPPGILSGRAGDFGMERRSRDMEAQQTGRVRDL
jgi:hypothetical protein